MAEYLNKRVVIEVYGGTVYKGVLTDINTEKKLLSLRDVTRNNRPCDDHSMDICTSGIKQITLAGLNKLTDITGSFSDANLERMVKPTCANNGDGDGNGDGGSNSNNNNSNNGSSSSSSSTNFYSNSNNNKKKINNSKENKQKRNLMKSERNGKDREFCGYRQTYHNNNNNNNSNNRSNNNNNIPVRSEPMMYGVNRELYGCSYYNHNNKSNIPTRSEPMYGANTPFYSGDLPGMVPLSLSPCERGIPPGGIHHSSSKEVPNAPPPPVNYASCPAAKGRREDCFNMSLSQMQKHFDFEKNLALFNKKEFAESLNNGGQAVKPGIKGCYGPNENIIEGAAAANCSRHIGLPWRSEKEYVTDEGVIVPTISEERKRSVLSIANHYGYTFERQNEVIARSCSDMILQLLGGGRRLCAKNAHQVPLLMVFCSLNNQGASAISCARHLESYGVKTRIYLRSENCITQLATQELALYERTSGLCIDSVKDLPPACDVDFVIMCLESADETVYMNEPLMQWFSECKASFLSIDPSQNGNPYIPVKYSVASFLPFAYSENNGKIYLCNLAIPSSVLEEFEITYCSPFGSKSIIPLHPTQNTAA